MVKYIIKALTREIIDSGIALVFFGLIGCAVHGIYRLAGEATPVVLILGFLIAVSAKDI